MACFIREGGSDIVWSERTLAYEKPSVPTSFQMPLPPNSMQWVGPAHAVQLLPKEYFTEGSDLYLSAHRAGWNSCRYSFFRGFPGEKSYKIVATADQLNLRDEDQIPSAAKFAYATGFQKCEAQIRELTSFMSDRELRRRIGGWQIKGESTFALGIVCLILFAVAIVRDNRQLIAAESQ